LTIEPENIKTVLATNFKDFSLGKRRHDNFFPLLGDGIFTLDGAGWEHSRALLRPQFNRDQISDLDALEIYVQRLFDFVPKNENEAIDLQPLIFRLTLDSATEFLFGESADSLLDKDFDASMKDGELTFAQAFDGAQDWIAYRGRFASLYWLVNPKDFQRKCGFVHNWVNKYVERSLHPEKRGERMSGRKYGI
jgi:cytochrome P450